ncbi:MAG TPA: sigma 54-interacting response regulator [Niastella sp.]
MNSKVLIVEDEFIVANDLRLILQQAGYKIMGIAVSCEEAQEKIKKDKPDLVLLDIQLNGKLSGIDLAWKLKEDNIAFLYLSAYSSQKIMEEAKTTEPYGFLVKPFREKDLLAALEIALYRHKHSLEAKSRQADLLQKQILQISNTGTNAKQNFFNLAGVMQSYIPFDLITSGCRPFETAQLNDIGYLRTGFDEYQFISEKELLTITNLKKTSLSVILANSSTDPRMTIYDNDPAGKKPNVPSLQKTLMETFDLLSCLVFPVTLSNGRSFHYFFYSRRQSIYTGNHIALLSQAQAQFTGLAQKLIYAEDAGLSVINQSGPSVNKQTNAEDHLVFKNIIGSHHLLLTALDLTAQVAPYNTSVLILGESGTGKERIAEAIHSLSQRSKGPFIKVNCAAIPATLIESELFGHEKGAFTGAYEKRKGKFELADGGTLFLDEIGELPLEMQVKLLRVLQEKEIQPVGSNTAMKVNVRIVTATNRNLEKEVAEGKFRLDLYYRLNVFPISMPPLRERKSDIEALTIFFATKFCREFNKPFHGVAESMKAEMLAYDWPGNIRELENVLEQAAILNDGKSLLQLKRSLVRTTEETPVADIKTMEDLKRVQYETERTYIISILKKANWRIRGANGAAELLNLKPTTLESKIERLNIKREDFVNTK